MIAVTGCAYSVPFDDCQVTCATTQTCPGDLTCSAGLCRLPGMTGACGSGGGGNTTLSQTANTMIDHNLQFGCANSDNTSAENSWYRVFTVGSTLHVDHVTVGICFSVAGAGSGSGTLPKLDVKLGTYSGSTGQSTLDLTKITPLKAATIDVPATQITELLDVPLATDVGAGQNLIVEVHNSDLKGTGESVDLGATDAAQTAAPYLRSPLCGSTVPTVNNTNAHMVITVTGNE